MSVLAIAAKELALYFTSLVFYALAAVFLALSGYLFYTNLDFYVRFGGMNLVLGLWQYQFYDMRQLLLVLVPLLTMRLFAEEKRQGTIELLATSPITDWQVVIGKFLASSGLYALMILASLVNVAGIWLYASSKPEWKPVVTGGLGLFLLGACFLAMGTFVLEAASDGDLARLAGEAVQQAGLGLVELRQEPLDLEEVFLELVRRGEHAS